MKRIILLSMFFIFTLLESPAIYGGGKALSFLTGFTLIPYLRAEEISLTIDEAIGIALRDNKDIALKAEDVKKQKAKIEEARAALYPTFDVTANWYRNRDYYSKDFNYATTQFTLKQYLYKGGETLNNIKYNEYLTKADEAILDKTKMETVLNVKKSFYTLLLANRFALLNKAILNNTLEHLESAEVLYKNGQASESDILKIYASFESVKQAYETSLNQVASSQALLNNYLYLDKDVEIVPKGEFIYREEDIAYDGALLEALRLRPEIRQYENEELASERYIEVVKADQRPSIYASWDYYSRSHAAAGTARGWSDYNVIGITFSWPVFDGWATKAKIEQANVDLKEAQITKEKAKKDIALELKNAYLSLKNAIVKINTTESDIKVYNNNLLTVKQKFKEGVASLLDMQDAVLKYSISRFNNMQALYDYVIAKTNFDKAMGAI
jgi:outer membrane protein TolC